MVSIWPVLLMSIFLTGAAYAQGSCPEPMVQLTRDVKGKVEGSLDTWLKMGNLKAAGDIDTFTNDVMHDYPNADQVALRQNTLSIICNKVLSSSDYSKEFKEKVVEKLLDAISSSPADQKKRINFIVRPDNPGLFKILINNQTQQPLNLTRGKLTVSGQPSQTFDMQIGPEVGGPFTSSFPPSAQGAVSGILFTCLYGREGWAALYAMRYGPNPSLDQRQCRICINARMPNGDDVEPCEDIPCSAVAVPVVGQNCEPPSPNAGAGACRMPDGTISPRISPSGCVARGGSWLTPTPINR